MADFPRLWQAKFLWQNRDEGRAKAGARIRIRRRGLL